MADFLRNRIILISNESFSTLTLISNEGHFWLRLCVAVIVVKDLSCLGRTKSLPNAVIVCQIDDLGRFVTKDLCAHSYPRRVKRVLFSS